MKDLLILRHGHTKSLGADGDQARELKDKGKRNAQRMGVWLARQGLLPDIIISSPAIRANRTAEKCCKTAGLRGSDVVIEPRLYDGDSGEIAGLIRRLPADKKRLLLVGHNPVLEQLVLDLSERIVGLAPASLLQLTHDGNWTSLGLKSCEFVRQIDADQLPELFPYPSFDDVETRTRPAYYYQQSSVVPFREGQNGLEVLIVSSSKHKHWVIPKGIQDPGLTAQDSAAIEAFEEAGVEGEVLDKPIGTYSYPKWDAACEVTVYPMRVTHELSEDDWEESHRGRRWVSVGDAASLVLNDDVKAIIAMLPDAIASQGG